MQLRSALHFGFDALADAFNASFEGYTVTMKFDPAALEARARAESWELASSFIAHRGSQVAGALFVSRRGKRARVAAMAVTPPHRRTGVGRAMMERCVSESRARGDASLVLEVLESNLAASALYEAVGFSRTRRLIGWERESLAAASQRVPDFREIEVADLAARVYAGADPEPPWQIDPASLVGLTPPARAFALGDRAAALVVDPGQGRITLRAIVVPKELRRAGHASTLLAQLGAIFPGRSWSTPFAIPEGTADGFFLAHGFAPSAHPIWEMARVD